MNFESLREQCEQIEAEIDKGGWDQPHMFLTITGTPEEPKLARSEIDLETFPHPVIFLRELWKSGVDMSPLLGAGLVYESYRHMHFEEAIEAPEHPIYMTREKILKLAADANVEQVNIGEDVMPIEEATRKSLEKVWNKALSEGGVLPPSKMAEGARVEARTMSLHFRDNSFVFYAHDRFTDKREYYDSTTSEDKQPNGRIVEAVVNLLNNKNPDEDGDFDHMKATLHG